MPTALSMNDWKGLRRRRRRLKPYGEKPRERGLNPAGHCQPGVNAGPSTAGAAKPRERGLACEPPLWKPDEAGRTNSIHQLPRVGFQIIVDSLHTLNCFRKEAHRLLHPALALRSYLGH